MTKVKDLVPGKSYEIREIHALSPRTESDVNPKILVFAWCDGNTIGAFSAPMFDVVWGDFKVSEVVIPEDRKNAATLRLRHGDVGIYYHREKLPSEALISGNSNARIKEDAMFLGAGIGGNIVY